MQVNTVVSARLSVYTSSFPKKTAKRAPDPFTVVGGNFVGHDGFVVPRDFNEFSDRFPNHVHGWVWQHTGMQARTEDVEDWTQDLTIHLTTLPARSKYRQAGKHDLVQTFDPERHYGANAARFWNYINLCLTNRFRTIYRVRMNEPTCRPGNVSIYDDSDPEEHVGVGDEFCQRHSARLRTASKILLKQAQDRQFINEFVAYVWRNDEQALNGIGAIAVSNSPGEAAACLGVTGEQFARIHRRLRQLGECFEMGAPVPKQRKQYRRRSRRSNVLVADIHCTAR